MKGGSARGPARTGAVDGGSTKQHSRSSDRILRAISDQHLYGLVLQGNCNTSLCMPNKLLLLGEDRTRISRTGRATRAKRSTLRAAPFVLVPLLLLGLVYYVYVQELPSAELKAGSGQQFLSRSGTALWKQQPSAGGRVACARGVSPRHLFQYCCTGSFVCSDGSEISCAWVNDDYCDCLDGSDEPGTPACSHTKVCCCHA